MQHLNLYAQLDRRAEVAFNVYQQAWALGALVVVALVVALSLQLGRWQLAERVAGLEAEQSAARQALESLQARYEAARADDTLEREVAALERQRAFLQKALATIEQPGDAAPAGFADYLSGLARQHVSGLWFTELSLSAGGNEMALSGKTKQPEYLPRYLQKLAQEPLFTGQRFRIFRMNRPIDESGPIRFEIRAKGVDG